MVGSEFVTYIYYNKQINGIRCVDKVIPGKRNIYRLEVWVNKSIDLRLLEELKSKMSTTFGDRVELKGIS